MFKLSSCKQYLLNSSFKHNSFSKSQKDAYVTPIIIAASPFLGDFLEICGNNGDFNNREHLRVLSDTAIDAAF